MNIPYFVGGGSVKIGGQAKIGANAVVLTHVPPYATAIGVPAKIR